MGAAVVSGLEGPAGPIWCFRLVSPPPLSVTLILELSKAATMETMPIAQRAAVVSSKRGELPACPEVRLRWLSVCFHATRGPFLNDTAGDLVVYTILLSYDGIDILFCCRRLLGDIVIVCPARLLIVQRVADFLTSL